MIIKPFTMTKGVDLVEQFIVLAEVVAIVIDKPQRPLNSNIPDF